MTIRHKHIDLEAARASARDAASRRTCDGCALLRIHPRPMCAGEGSPHYRTARDTYHERCQSYAVRGHEGRPIAAETPKAAEAKPKRYYIKGDVSRRMAT